jgi:hypothetical protein
VLAVQNCIYSLIVFIMFTLNICTGVIVACILQQTERERVLTKPHFHIILRQPIHTRAHISRIRKLPLLCYRLCNPLTKS